MTRKEFDEVVSHFGIDRIVARLPQSEVCNVLGLVCLKELTQKVGVSYDVFRRYLESGTVPYPEVRINRRAYYTQTEAQAIKRKLKNDK